MPQGVDKPRRPKSSTARRQNTVLKIRALGRELLEMGRCTPCQNSDSVCFVLDGCARCNTCTKKNIKECDGTFSDAEFDALTAQRNRLVEAARRKGEEIRSLLKTATRAAEALVAANAAMASAQNERARLESDAEKLLDKQKDMVIREANALDELDHVDPPPIASSAVFVGLDDAQLEEMFELEPGSMFGYESPIPIDRPSA
jgi:hypothetical protein